MPGQDLKQQATHFAFGKNWASYASLIGDTEIAEARKGLLKLVPEDALRGRSFIDIGCGSGLHALAAASCGVGRIMAIDIDPDSVATTRQVLQQYAVSVPWEVEEISIFDLDASKHGTYDIVYSWGVLHHTGAMVEAIGKAAALVAPGGLFAFALYRRTRMDRFWIAEKRFYARSPQALQWLVRHAYIAAFATAMTLQGGSFSNYVANYRSTRGMNWHHDVHDWLGGYPYEAILAPEVEELMQEHGFEAVRVFSRAMTSGVLGSGCDEYVYRRRA